MPEFLKLPTNLEPNDFRSYTGSAEPSTMVHNNITQSIHGEISSSIVNTTVLHVPVLVVLVLVLCLWEKARLASYNVGRVANRGPHISWG